MSKIEVVDNSEKVLKMFETAIGAGLNTVGSQATDYAQDLTPVRTGALRNSISWEVSEDESSVEIGVLKSAPALVPGNQLPKNYALFIEEGTSKTKAHHMLRRAASEHKEEYKKIIEKGLKNA